MLSQKLLLSSRPEQKLNNDSLMEVPLTAGLFIRLHYIVAVVLCPKLLCSPAVEVFLLA